jgi:hypothetical protein
VWRPACSSGSEWVDPVHSVRSTFRWSSSDTVEVADFALLDVIPTTFLIRPRPAMSLIAGIL